MYGSFDTNTSGFDTNIHPKCFSHIYRISSNNNRAQFFLAPKGGDYSRKTIISGIVHWRSCP